MKYVMSDLHGEYDKFIKMLELIDFKEEDKLYILGDIVDRGKYPIRLLLYIMSKPNIEVLLGNHEEMILKSLVENDLGYYRCWMQNGGATTLNHYDNINPKRQREILDYLQQLKLTITVDDFILVHAGIDFNEDGIQSRETLLWARDEFIFGKERFDGIDVIFGHTPTCFMQSDIKPMKIWHEKGKIGIDCGCCFDGGQLGCLRLDDMKEFYV